MKKKISKILVILLALFLVGCGKTQYSFKEESGKGIISEYTGSDSYLKVPATINEKEVNIIDYNTYAYNIFIEHALISEHVNTIRGCAFWYCTNLTSIYLSKSVGMIEPYAFYNCPNLKYVFIEASEAEFVITIDEHNDALKKAQVRFGVSFEEYEAFVKEGK